MPRRVPAADEPLSRVRLRTGHELLVIDVSNAGVLVQSPARLLPGTHVDVHVVTWDGRILVRSRVIRAYVCALQSDAIWYHGALAFDRPIDTTMYQREAA
jgi:predicted DCC family thiol-disulfide oxidoreductase YuxK